MYRTVFLLVFVIIGYFIQNVRSETSSALPDLLHDCYTNETLLFQKQPLTLQLFLEIIRKIELNNDTNINARMLSTSMLHSVILDGIRKSQEIVDSSFIIPYAAVGEEFYKYKLVVDYLTSGESSLFPAETLTIPELCFLHMMVSNTVDPWERGDESNTCSHQSSMPFEVEGMAERSQISSCPIKKGSLSTKWGSVSIGHVIAAMASSFQKITVPLARIEEAINKVTKEKETLTTNNEVDNLWVATVAGDLAAVILKQATNSLEFGINGFWNDTLLPRMYYLKSANWDMTESDILGSIDGLAIAHHLENGNTNNLRLSQLIDMYYSERIVPKYSEYRVTNRSSALNKLLDEIDLEAQVVSATTLLQKVGIYNTKLTSQQISDLSKIATDKFKVIAGNITKIYDNVESLRGVTLKSSMEITLILDGSYGPYTSLELVHGLIEVAQVSYYGSRLGIVNGETGKWITNTTSDLFRIFNDLERSTDGWPSSMNLARSLESVIHYYQRKTSMDCLTEKTKPIARIVLIASRNGYLTDNDLESSIRAFTSIKKSNPETSFILLTSLEIQTRFTELTRHFWDNDYVLTPAGSMNSVIQDISKTFSDIPGNIINFYCSQSQIHLEDYITPNVTTVYQIRQEYIKAAPVTTKFSKKNTNGNVVVCAYEYSTRINEICKEITVNDEISFDSVDLCASESACNLEFSISVNTTEISCTENGCRYPDQVRLEIIWQRSSGCRLLIIDLSYLLMFIVIFIL